MPRKKAEPEVLQEETVQPEITDIEELTPAEQPALEPQIEEPVQPYGEGESSAAEEPPEPSEPEKKSFYDLDFRALDQDLSPEQRQEWNTIYAFFRSRSVMRGTIIGVDPHSMTVRSAQTGFIEGIRHRLLDGDLQGAGLAVKLLDHAGQLVARMIRFPQVGDGGVAHVAL